MKRFFCCLVVICLLLCCLCVGVSAEGETAAVTVTKITWSGDNQPKPGAEIEFGVQLHNDATVDLAQGTVVNVSLYINQEKIFTKAYAGGVAAGATVEVIFPKWEAVAGEHVVTAVLNDTQPDRFNWLDKQHLAANIRVAEEALEVPEIAEKFGMTTLTFSDDFTTLDLFDKECTGAYGYKWYANVPYGAADCTPEDYVLTDVGLSVQRVPTLFNWALCTFDCETGAGWGFVHGYMEMRFRTAPNRLTDGKGKPAVWSLPPEKILSLPDLQNRYVETDFLEFFGEEIYSTTMHDLEFTNKHCNEYVHWYKNSNNEYIGLRDGEWHTMGFVRREGSMVCYLDGKEYMALSWEENGTSYPEAVLLKDGDGTDAFSVVDKQLTPIVLSGSNSWPLEVDYIQVWEGDQIPDGESPQAAQFIDAYLRDGEGQIMLTPNFENYESLSDVEAAFEQLPAEQQEELNALAQREVGKTIAQVTSDAKQFKTDMDAFVANYALDSEGVLLDAASLDACEVIVKGEATWKEMSAELKEAINNRLYLTKSTTYDDLLKAAREKVPALPESDSELTLKTWMIVVAAAVLLAVLAAIVIVIFRKKAKG